ncbi:DUF4124 domain-containing protein [Billgrantia gudaonensis]|uniref:DUF4124 domain-containing protein n=1 Tax=Billgrantia gudaonensis TaxID=376427 RepID=A0A1G8QAN5_9GAMM|nr:DUF4124 domain-containing protein [Halomonas gudaonensis]SDJ01869.1 protein of unknown function [Halomonas gudaonensis]
MTKTLLSIVLGLILAAPAGATTVYRTTDEQGNVVFTDNPERGGEKVELKPLTVVPARGEVRRDEASSAPAEPEGERQAASESSPFMPYDRFGIAAPANEETLPTGAAGKVAVELAIEPPLREDHRVRLLVDGEISQSALHTDAFLLNDLPRGEHVLQAELLDAGGDVRHRSDPVTLYVQRASVNLPQNPNNPAGGD